MGGLLTPLADEDCDGGRSSVRGFSGDRSSTVSNVIVGRLEVVPPVVALLINAGAGGTPNPEISPSSFLGEVL